ncbi:decaprenyl-phosphate phosphoribosyltransferase [Blastococcus sp. CT_GayMR16]|uniref:decaprenyl-phosphate phosphoribosyltransferase n=1 Tax=Blastococcus sp. CT_GayMR16 TaxID=2559607 RepID=UPI001073AAA8|nr:decaprenyl-phosphate phosphoribosyltransferase [Blastococcus sp. CT_GayMR16]TFV91084.1 decaprenyl-phosphate phosphoribosyltransferase [Blastococcus sp. CT_GayMR16]
MTATERPPSTPPMAVRARHAGAGFGAAVLATARPRQWPKNILVFAAPAAAGVLLQPAAAAAAVWAAGVFVLASASTYFINDARDVEADRLHPVKRRRPVAAGRLGVRTSYGIGLGLAVLAAVVALPLGPAMVGVVVLYLALTMGYSLWLKDQPVVELLAVASGFVLRAVAGGTAAGVPLSNWFLLVALFGSLFLVTAKRSAEARNSLARGTTRPVLDGYPSAWLQQILTVSLTGTVLAYASWALQYVGRDVALPVLALSVVPFLAVMLRYSLLVARGDGEAPEDVVFSDRFLLVAGILWAALVGGALYLA